MSQPLVSIIMSVYNTEKYVEQAIQSILDQTHTNLEFIIIDDGSTDRSDEIMRAYTDPRIVYAPNEGNKKIVYSFNKGLDLAKGDYIVFLGSDDYSIPERLAKQVAFLQQNKEVGFVGSDVRFVNMRGEYSDNQISYHATPFEVEVIMLFKNFFCASAVMFKREAIGDLRFDPEFPVAEDYDLYLRIFERGWKPANIQEPLTIYRIHDFNITYTAKDLVIEKDFKILRRQLQRLGVEYDDKALRFYFLVGKVDYSNFTEEYYSHSFYQADGYFQALVTANNTSKVYDQDTLVKYLYKQWHWFFVGRIYEYNAAVYKQVSQSPFYPHLPLFMRFKFYAKCMVGKK